jgi:prepilin-type N-terminal cleavage/methylation domain-containing protein
VENPKHEIRNSKQGSKSKFRNFGHLDLFRISIFGFRISHHGFSLLELLVALGIIALVALTVLGLLGRSIEVLRREEHRRIAIGIAEERIERLRNSPYDDLGTVGGIPTGAFSPLETIQRNSAQYTVATRIRFMDDLFDGTAPNDPVPNDMREVAVDVSWGTNPNQIVTLATLVAPPGLERAGTTGTLKLRVLDARGNPVDGATVELANASVTPPIALALPTDTNGEVTLPGAPPSTASYHVRVTKNGYNTDETVTPNPEVPNPTQPPLTVIEHEVTTAGFAIDRLATIAFTFQKYRPNQPFRDLATFTLQGLKTIGTRPNPAPPPETLPVYKAGPQSLTTNQGTLTISSLEWDTYEFRETMPDYDLAVADPLLPIELLPGTTYPITIMFAPHRDHSLRVIVRDAAGMPVPDAVVTLTYVGPPERTESETTPAHGQVFLSPLQSGAATLTVAKDGFEAATRELIVSGTMEVEVRLQRL